MTAGPGVPVEILLIEDNPGDVGLARAAFQDMRLANRLSAVIDGGQALAFLRREGDFHDASRPDLILLDLNLPDRSGMDVLKEIKDDPALRSIPVVVLTTSSADFDVAAAYDLHANSFITKPIDLEGLTRVVSSIEAFWFSIVRLPEPRTAVRQQCGARGHMSEQQTALQVDLDTCQREPVHAPGAIQPHGLFCALHPDNGTVCAASDNLAAVVGRDRREIAGQPPSALFDPNAATHLEEILSGARGPLPFEVTLGKDTPYWATPYWSDGLLALDLEPDRDREQANEASLMAMAAMERLRLIEGVEDLTNEMALSVADLLGFDRTMVYRFDDEYNGTVVAEAMNRPLAQSFLGLTYPHSDIPPQARALFARNRVRAIPDVADARAEILPAVNPLTRAPLDLSDSVLRSVSPIHIEYLRNMGVGGSLTIALFQGSKLWGLIACHHETPRHVSPRLRPPCILMCEAFSGRVSEIEAEERAGRLTEKLRRVGRIYARDFDVDELLDPSGVLSTVASDARDILEADGLWIKIGDLSATSGSLPDDDELEALLSAAQEASGPFPGRLVLSESLESINKAATAACAGLLYYQFPGDRGHVLAIRREEPEAINWAGDPSGKVRTDPRTQRLHPRQSFDLFRAQRRGRSKPWPPETEAIVPDLAYCLMRFTEMFREIAEQELRGSVADLEQSIYIASHDLQEPLRMVTSYLNLLANRYRGRLDEEADEFIGFAVDGATRMSALLKDLFTFSQIRRDQSDFRPVDCETVLADVEQLLRVQIDEAGATVTHDPLPTVSGDETQLVRLFQNLVGNAIKYHGDQPPRIHVSAEEAGSRWRISITDNGIGIAPDARERVFQIFRRLHGRGEYSGSGVGLSVCKRIVERHQGRIWVDAGPDGGSVFRFTLPRSQRARSAA